MEELELLLTRIMNEKNIGKEGIYDLVASYGYTELRQLSLEQLDKIDRIFDYESAASECFTNQLARRTEFTTASSTEKRKCRGNVYLSVKDSSLEFVLDNIIKFLVDKNIYSKGYVSTYVQNDSIMVGFEKQCEIEQFINFLRSGIFSSHFKKTTPFIPNYGGIGFVNYSGDGDYLNALSEYLYLIKASFGANVPEYFSFELLIEILEKSSKSTRIPDPVKIKDVIENLQMIDSKMSQKRK